MTLVITLDGTIINEGPWDYRIRTERVVGNPYPGEDLPPDDWDFEISFKDFIDNPLPEGAVEEDVETVRTAKDRLVFATDWYNLREDAYPAIADQLDAFWKGGTEAEAMVAAVTAIKVRYPKPD